ncbi:probable E3 ubiquitin-protein ligase HERC6 [Hemitrygon akajei]|uniref:probable E3 ubiquitin-protein ligase HERC6 n=1 Tax=Hemitrygon akajei TaxID=2704970 RepID=UPI003BF972FD
MEHTKMFCWGDGVAVQVALSDSGEHGPREIEFLWNRPVKEVSCGAEHSVFLLTDGTVYTCGQNESGQLGRKNDQSALDRVTSLATKTIVNVACGKYHTLALCENGSVFAWGAGTYGQLGKEDYPTCVSKPRKVKDFGVPIVQIRCGHYHSLALSQDGTVYSWGQNTYGQLGNGKALEKQNYPKRVKNLTGIPVALIAAGGSHSFALSLSGAVHGWGRNEHGQLGLKDKKDREFPCSVNQLRRLNVAYISCGSHHSVVLTKDGAVFTCGDGSSGQLGLGRKGNVTSFQRVEQIKGEVSQIACGSDHTLAYIPSLNVVVSFGFGNQGKTKEGSSGNQIQQEFQHAEVNKIFAGPNINFFQTKLQMPAVDLRCRDSKEQMLMLDTTIAERWINIDEYNDAEREIGLIFSSSSCLVGSFLKRGEGDNLVSVDVEAAREIFQKLTEKDWIFKVIRSSLTSKLIQHLERLGSDEEALMIYLILPECQVMKEYRDLVNGFIKAIAHLDAPSKDILGKHWSTLKSSYLNTVVEIIKTPLTRKIIDLFHLCQQLHPSLALQFNNQQTDFKNVLDVLKLLYKANMKLKHSIPLSNFYISELRLFSFDMALTCRAEQLTTNIILMFLSYPFILDLILKAQLLYMDSDMKMQKAVFDAFHFTLRNSLAGSPEPFRCAWFILKVNRQSLVPDTFEILKNVNKAELQKSLLVEFKGEPGVDLEAIKREFFTSVFERLVHRDSNMFIHFQSTGSIWLPSQVSVPIQDYFLLGVLCGLVVYNKCLISIPLPLALFKKLLDIKPTLEDVFEVDLELHNHLQNILIYDKIEELEMDCTMRWQERDVVIPNGGNGHLTTKNKKKFVDSCLNYIFETSIKKLFDELRKGFYHVLDEKLIKLFQPQELKDMLIGSIEYDWQILEENTSYQGTYHRSHPTIKIFWEVFHQMFPDQKKLFLSFVTGYRQILAMGLQYIKIFISSCELTENDYPEAMNCFNILRLPEYTSSESLRTKLVAAINTFRRA